MGFWEWVYVLGLEFYGRRAFKGKSFCCAFIGHLLHSGHRGFCLVATNLQDPESGPKLGLDDHGAYKGLASIA